MKTIAEIKAMLDEHGGLVLGDEELAIGALEAHDGTHVEYKLYGGLDLLMANACDNLWGTFNVKLLAFIEAMNLADQELSDVLEGIQIDDAHWQWLVKSLVHRTDEYRWFFLVAENKPQAACLIYHPKDSAIDGESIFYIEYVAAAPWNRKNPMEARHFKKVGTIIIQQASEYAVSQLKLRPGYCLHALPKAVPFYEMLGMLPFPDRDKGTLPYFELPSELCHVTAGVA